jgi:hypothetical protein
MNHRKGNLRYPESNLILRRQDLFAADPVSRSEGGSEAC